MTSLSSGVRRQRGATLLMALILLLAITIVAVMIARGQVLEERMAVNDHNHELAVESAEAGLRTGEYGLLTGLYLDNAFAGNSNGLFELSANSGDVSSQNVVVWESGTNVLSGPSLSSVASPSQFYIERLPIAVGSGQNTGGYQYGQQSPAVGTYRVTARAVGGDSTAVAVLQSIVRK
jgi:type IV pilus assembly protein PilX